MCLHNFGKANVTLLHGNENADVVLEKGDVVLVFDDAEAAETFAENPTMRAPWATDSLTQARLFIVAGYAGETLGGAVLAGARDDFPLGTYVVVRPGEFADVRHAPEKLTTLQREALGLLAAPKRDEEDDLWA